MCSGFGRLWENASGVSHLLCTRSVWLEYLQLCLVLVQLFLVVQAVEHGKLLMQFSDVFMSHSGQELREEPICTSQSGPDAVGLPRRRGDVDV